MLVKTHLASSEKSYSLSPPAGLYLQLDTHCRMFSDATSPSPHGVHDSMPQGLLSRTMWFAGQGRHWVLLGSMYEPAGHGIHLRQNIFTAVKRLLVTIVTGDSIQQTLLCSQIWDIKTFTVVKRFACKYSDGRLDTADTILQPDMGCNRGKTFTVIKVVTIVLVS